MTGLRLNVLLTLYREAKEAYKSGENLQLLTVVQATEAKQLQSFADKCISKEVISTTEAVRLLKASLKGVSFRKEISATNTASLLNYILHTKKVRRSGVLAYKVIGQHDFTTYLLAEGLNFSDVENFTEKLHKRLNFKEVFDTGNTDVFYKE